MHLDEYGLPVQADGDANDQLQRCSMVIEASALGNRQAGLLAPGFAEAMEGPLQPRPGVYVRHVGGDPRNVSGDQLIAAHAAWVARKEWKQACWITLRTLLRGGFAQNTRDMYGREGWKVPDFILFRAAPLMIRSHWLIFYGFAFVAGMLAAWVSPWLGLVFFLPDLFLVMAACLASAPVWKDDEGFAKRTPDDVDDNVNVAVFLACYHRLPTPLSLLAWWTFKALRPWNYGCQAEVNGMVIDFAYPPVYGALRWYHRAESGGNPEIATFFKDLVS